MVDGRSLPALQSNAFISKFPCLVAELIGLGI